MLRQAFAAGHVGTAFVRAPARLPPAAQSRIRIHIGDLAAGVPVDCAPAWPSPQALAFPVSTRSTQAEPRQIAAGEHRRSWHGDPSLTTAGRSARFARSPESGFLAGPALEF
jgi:hypothetical protein